MRLPRRPAFRFVAALVCGFAAASLWAQDGPTVAAAADLKFALDEVAQRFQVEQGQRVRLVFGASGQLATQILHGAPFQLFLSADESLVHQLAEAGKTEGRGRVYAHGRIVLMVPKGGRVRADANLQDLAAALRDGRLRKFAVAHPEHAPYGARARAALERAGLWQALQPHLVLGENVAQAAQFVATGAAQAGVVASSMAQAPTLAPKVDFAPLPESWYPPLRQRMVLMHGASPTARAFFHYLASPSSRAILARHGLAPPQD